MLHIEKYAADCLTFSNADDSRNLKKYFFSSAALYKGALSSGSAFFSVYRWRIVKMCSIENKEGIRYNGKKSFACWIMREKSVCYEFYIHRPMQRWYAVYRMDE